jgi:hypothetical protein
MMMESGYNRLRYKEQVQPSTATAAEGISPHNTSAASFLALGLEIEDTQYVHCSSSIYT